MQIILSIVSAVITGVIGYFFYRLKKISESRAAAEKQRLDEISAREDAIDEALRALCRDRILQGYRYFKSKDGITMQDLETMTKLYKAYHSLNGNGTTTAVYEKILQLHIVEGD